MALKNLSPDKKDNAMLTREVSQKYFNNALVSIHSKRANCLFETSLALLNNGRLSVSSLGQNKAGTANVKHKIKSVDRLLSNDKLHAEIPYIYKHFFAPVIMCQNIVRILIDWSGCCGDQWYMLRASVVHDGRSITIYNEIYPRKKVGQRKIQNNFLKKLKTMIPPEKTVIIITDSGFVTPWFKQVLKLGWHYIGRLPGYIMLRFKNKEQWTYVSDFKHKIKNHVKNLGEAVAGKYAKNPLKCNIYSYQENLKKRKEKSKFPDQNKQYGKLAKKPWILATSLDEDSYGGNFIKNGYKSRMQIEQNFRDEKSPRFGFGWRFGRSGCLNRIAVLCLISHIAYFFLLSIGVLAERLGMHKKFQVNTTNRRVLSFITLAKQILKQGPPLNLEKEYDNCLFSFTQNFEVSSSC